MKTLSNHTYHFSIRTLTPVALGNVPETASSLGQYIFKDGKIFYLDLNRLATHPNVIKLSDEELKHKMNAFSTEILNKIDNNRISEEFMEILKRYFSIEEKDIITKSFPAFGLEEGKQRVLRPILKTSDKPYFSGSTLKGAIKTAIVYDWLVNNEEGKSYLVNEIAKEIKRLYSEADKIKKKLKVEGIDCQTKRQLERSLRDKQKQVDQLSEKLTIEIFGKLKTQNQLHSMNFFRVIDSTCLKEEVIELHALKRINMESVRKKDWENKNSTDASEIPMLTETVRAKSNLDFRIQLDAIANHEMSPYLKGIFFPLKDFKTNLLQIINQFSDACLDYEVDFMESSREFEAYTNEVLKLTAIRNENSAKLRIGFGKNYYHVSMGLALKKIDPEVFKQLTYLMDWREEPDKIATDFPHTRFVTKEGSLPLGWIELSFKNFEEYKPATDLINRLNKALYTDIKERQQSNYLKKT